FEVRKSTDGGRTWGTTVTPSTNYLGSEGQYANAVAVDPTNANIVYLGGAFKGTDSSGNLTNSVLGSTNGGGTWTDLTVGSGGTTGVPSEQHALVVDPNGKLLAGNDGGIWRLDKSSGSPTWSDLNGDLAITLLNGVAANPTDFGSAFGGSQAT